MEDVYRMIALLACATAAVTGAGMRRFGMAFAACLCLAAPGLARADDAGDKDAAPQAFAAHIQFTADNSFEITKLDPVGTASASPRSSTTQ